MDFLPCYFYQIERGNIYQCCLDRVFCKTGAEFPHEAFYIFLCVHIDKIYNDYAGEVSEADLPGCFSGSLQIDLQDIFRIPSSFFPFPVMLLPEFTSITVRASVGCMIR